MPARSGNNSSELDDCSENGLLQAGTWSNATPANFTTVSNFSIFLFYCQIRKMDMWRWRDSLIISREVLILTLPIFITYKV